MKLCAIWPAVSLCQTKHPVTPPLALLIAEQRANISVCRIFKEKSLLEMLLTMCVRIRYAMDRFM